MYRYGQVFWQHCTYMYFPQNLCSLRDEHVAYWATRCTKSLKLTSWAENWLFRGILLQYWSVKFLFVFCLYLLQADLSSMNPRSMNPSLNKWLHRNNTRHCYFSVNALNGLRLFTTPTNFLPVNYSQCMDFSSRTITTDELYWLKYRTTSSAHYAE